LGRIDVRYLIRNCPDFEAMTPPSFENLVLIDVASLPVSDGLHFLGWLIDLSSDQLDMSLQEKGTARALEWAETIGKMALTDTQRLDLDYFRANAWGNRARKTQDKQAIWVWDNEPLRHQILLLRGAVGNPAFDGAEAVRKCEVLTNLANSLHTVGRFIEAHEYWNRAIVIEPRFWMALGNRGCGRIEYANAVYSQQEREELIWAAYRDLTRAVELVREYPFGSQGALEFFKGHIDVLLARFGPDFLNHEMEFIDYSLGRSHREKDYRTWALRETLFLSALNDLGTFSAAASDPLHLPDFVAPLDEPPVLIGFFNQIKQEYVSARWLLFDAIVSDKPHFSDREVHHLNTLDYPVYCLAVEKMKLAFRATYSIFDKIAYFLNTYIKLRIPEKQVNFRSVWSVEVNKMRTIRPEFEGMENWPLRGLYWLSKDLSEAAFSDITEPDSRDINTVRNHLEHKYLKIHDDLFSLVPKIDPLFTDTLAHSVTRSDLKKKTLRLLKLARAALIYLACGMSARERRLCEEKGHGVMIPNMELPTMGHQFKI
jgi:tetratricopeptide (TPR) repeat protein